MSIFIRKKEKHGKFFIIKKLYLIVLALSFVIPGASYAQISIFNSPRCSDLMAGQHTDAGNVCLEVSDEILYVTYTTTGAWELTKVHLWIGADLADMPRNKKGNPKVGHFPYYSGDITGEKMYCFSIPLTDIGGNDIYNTLCDKIYLAAAHASLRIEDGNGGYRTETGWAAGTRIVPKGNWAMFFDFQFICQNIPPVVECKRAFAFGDKALWDIIGPNGNPITNGWGWQNTVYPGDRITRPFYMDATQNNPNNGTCVGYVYIAYSGSMIIVEFFTTPPYAMKKTHLYVGTGELNTANPGQFGNVHYLQYDYSDVYRIQVSGSPVYVVAHSRVCDLQ